MKMISARLAYNRIVTDFLVVCREYHQKRETFSASLLILHTDVFKGRLAKLGLPIPLIDMIPSAETGGYWYKTRLTEEQEKYLDEHYAKEE